MSADPRLSSLVQNYAVRALDGTRPPDERLNALRALNVTVCAHALYGDEPAGWAGQLEPLFGDPQLRCEACLCAVKLLEHCDVPQRLKAPVALTAALLTEPSLVMTHFEIFTAWLASLTYRAAAVTSALAPELSKAQTALLGLFKDASKEKRSNAARCLVTMAHTRPLSPDSLANLQAGLDSVDPEIQAAALQLLVPFALQLTPVLPKITALLDGERTVLPAVTLLSAMGPAARTASGKLLELAEQGKPEIRFAVLSTLAAVGVSELDRALTAYRRQRARRQLSAPDCWGVVLAPFGPRAREALPDLYEAIAELHNAHDQQGLLERLNRLVTAIARLEESHAIAIFERVFDEMGKWESAEGNRKKGPLTALFVEALETVARALPLTPEDIMGSLSRRLHRLRGAALVAYFNRTATERQAQVIENALRSNVNRYTTVFLAACLLIGKLPAEHYERRLALSALALADKSLSHEAAAAVFAALSDGAQGQPPKLVDRARQVIVNFVALGPYREEVESAGSALLALG